MDDLIKTRNGYKTRTEVMRNADMKPPRAIGDKHLWFAWHPVLTEDGKKWLKKVVRQRWEMSEGNLRHTDDDGNLIIKQVGFWRYGTVEKHGQGITEP